MNRDYFLEMKDIEKHALIFKPYTKGLPGMVKRTGNSFMFTYDIRCGIIWNVPNNHVEVPEHIAEMFSRMWKASVARLPFGGFYPKRNTLYSNPVRNHAFELQAIYRYWLDNYGIMSNELLDRGYFDIDEDIPTLPVYIKYQYNNVYKKDGLFTLDQFRNKVHDYLKAYPCTYRLMNTLASWLQELKMAHNQCERKLGLQRYEEMSKITKSLLFNYEYGIVKGKSTRRFTHKGIKIPVSGHALGKYIVDCIQKGDIDGLNLQPDITKTVFANQKNILNKYLDISHVNLSSPVKVSKDLHEFYAKEHHVGNLTLKPVTHGSQIVPLKEEFNNCLLEMANKIHSGWWRLFEVSFHNGESVERALLGFHALLNSHCWYESKKKGELDIRTSKFLKPAKINLYTLSQLLGINNEDVSKELKESINDLLVSELGE